MCLASLDSTVQKCSFQVAFLSNSTPRNLTAAFVSMILSYNYVFYTNIRTLCKSKKNSMKTLKTIVTDWFVDNKLSIHFVEDKTESILFGSKQRAKNVRRLNIKY